MLPFNLGIPEVIVILGVALVIFGPKKLPELGRNLGKGLKNFKESLSSAANEMKAGLNENDDNEKIK
ncbi:MAG: twin-arginine translocase TatA/TatE family subunit [Candidatus Melainabacteria bacterium]|nr:twin-arginine translocase TatA/TatE family subunit [Candidatus Melainabacteria bacterium]